MKSFLKKIFRFLPSKLKLYLKKSIYGSINEVELVFEILRYKKNGVMLDVGAHHGSSLKRFLEAGWKIYAFEPNPNSLIHLQKATKGFCNVFISENAVSNKSDEEVPLYTSDVSSGISGLSKFHESHKATHTVKTITLADFLDAYSIKKIDFLKIDTEGFDLFVLQGYDWENTDHPDFIICEFEDRKTLPLEYDINDLVSFLKDKSYNVIISEWYPITEYGNTHKWKQFIMSNQIETLKEDSWGNIIAVKKDSKYLNRFESIVKI